MSSARLLLVSLLVLTAATPSRAAFHHALIDELMSGAAGNPAIQFVEMRMIASGQIQTNGSRLVTFNCDGTVVTTLLVVSGNISNGGVDRRWLMASPDATTFLAAAGISADFTWNPAVTGSIPTACGQVCWGKPPATGLGDPDNYRDCVAYGAYTGPLPTGAGPPSSSTPGDGTMSLTRGGPDRSLRRCRERIVADPVAYLLLGPQNAGKQQLADRGGVRRIAPADDRGQLDRARRRVEFRSVDHPAAVEGRVMHGFAVPLAEPA